MRDLKKGKIRLTAWLLAAVLICLAVPAGGLAAEKRKTEKSGKLMEESWVDESGALTAGPEGWARLKYAYTKQGTTEQYYSADGSAFVLPGGYSGRLLTYDNKKRLTSVTYLDGNGEKTMIGQGYARVRMDYTSFGETKLVSYYDENNRLVNVPSLGYASVRTEFRGKTMTKRSYLDEKENLTNTALGYAVMIQKVNKKNQVLSISFEHADGTPALCADGWSSCVKERDKDGRELSTKYYDVSGNLTDRGAGYAWTETSYSRNEVLTTHFSLDGQKVENAEGYVTLKQVVKDDLVIRESFLNAAGDPMLNRNGVGTVSYEYDTEGRVVQVTYQDLSGAACVSLAGYAGYRDTLDADGSLISRLFLGTDGKAAEVPEGYCEIRYSYDENGQLTNVHYYNNGGLQVSVSATEDE